jgi:hypothetical protein
MVWYRLDDGQDRLSNAVLAIKLISTSNMDKIKMKGDQWRSIIKLVRDKSEKTDCIILSN